jgi:hypothetical protein
MKSFIQFSILGALLLSLSAFGANPSFQSFDTNQFYGTTGTSKLGIKSDALTTNLVVLGTLSADSVVATNFIGNGAGLTDLNASALASGTVPTARINPSNSWSGSFTGNGAGMSNTVTAGSGITVSADGRTVSTNGVSPSIPVGNVTGATLTTNNATLTSGRVQVGDGARGIANATASGAVPIDADGTATTFAQVNALPPGPLLTNANSFSFLLSSNPVAPFEWVAINTNTHTFTAGTNTVTKITLCLTNGGQTNLSGNLQVPTAYVATGDLNVQGYSYTGNGFFVPRSGSTQIGLEPSAVNIGRIVNSGEVTCSLLLSNLHLQQQIYVTNGVASYASNQLASTSISVTASPFNWTNTLTKNVNVFLDANGATTAVNLNGAAIFGTLVSGDHTIPLQPGEWTTITYSVATPIMVWHPQ